MTQLTEAQLTSNKPYLKYLVGFLVLTIGSVWGLTAFYLADFELARSVLGDLQLTNPVVVIILHSPMIAALLVFFLYDGVRGIANFARTLVPRKGDLAWLGVLALVMLGYIFAVRFVSMLFGIDVPPDPQSAPEMLWTFLRMFIMEIGMIAITVGWYGFFLPMLHRITGGRHLLSGVLTGLGIALFVAPGNLFSSFELATAWPLYATQLSVLSVGMSYLLSRMKGNVLFFLIPFWVSASGSAMRLYYFNASTQLVQLTLFTILVVALYFVLRRQSNGKLDEPFTFPEYLENAYSKRKSAPLPGSGDRSLELSRETPERDDDTEPERELELA